MVGLLTNFDVTPGFDLGWIELNRRSAKVTGGMPSADVTRMIVQHECVEFSVNRTVACGPPR